ncbi:MAG: hypothetical protein AB7O62_21050 [Pirellulales bacterium]
MPQPMLSGGKISWFRSTVALLLVLAAAGTWAGTTRALAQGGDDTLDLLDDLNKNGGNWWNPDWRFRRLAELEGPGLDAVEEGIAFLQEPDPLLMFNTGRCAAQGADLRVVTRDGRALPCGVIGWGRDDGTCRLWCQLPDDELGQPGERGQKPVSLYLYYGNPAAKPNKADLPQRISFAKELAVATRLSAEELVPQGKKHETPKAGTFLSSVVTVEAEQFKTAAESDAPAAAMAQAAEGASAGALLVPRELPTAKKPVEASATAELPHGGKWFMHVRYQTRNGNTLYKPFSVLAGEQSFTCGADMPANGTGFHWQRFELELSAGESPRSLPLRLRFTAAAAPDCLLLTPNDSYLPDYRDVTGPVWVRVKLLREEDSPSEPFYVHWYCVHTPYSERGMLGDTACYLFRGQTARTKADARPLASDPDNLIQPGEWSAWGVSLHSAAYTWFSQLHLLTERDGTGRPLQNVRVAYQVSTRPDPARVYHEGIEEVGRGGMRIRMPTGLDQASLAQVESFGEWARRRFEIAENLGFQANEGPRQIIATTMGHFFETPTEFDYFMRTSNYLGLNAACIHYEDNGLFDRLADKYRIDGGVTHPFIYGLSFDGITKRRAGQTWLETAESEVFEQADAFYRGLDQDKSWCWQHARWGIVGDEIGPAVSSLEINGQPFHHQLFVEYLQQNGLKPDFLGAKKWDDVRAIDYIVQSDPRLQLALERQRRIAETDRAVAAAEERGLDGDLSATDDGLAADVLDSIATEGKEEEARPTLDIKYEKRVYHWTQKFRSEYTCRFYRQVTAALHRHAPDDFRATVNLQAAPAQSGTMWDGALNIFDLGRRQAFDGLYTEDWTGGTVNVAFAMGLLRAAARQPVDDRDGGKKPPQQQLGSYVVGGMPKGRVLANLSQGCRLMVFYLYGPIHNIGPVWGEDAATMQDIGQSLRLAGRTEDDLLASTNRPADAALLVANTSEINARHFSYDFGRDRLGVATALSDAQIPWEIVGEEEIIQGDALKNYRVLYVCDPHVASQTQAKIKQWVADGGTLWATYAALSGQEYGETSGTFDEVFGLKDRGPVLPAPAADDKAAPQAITVAAGQVLPAMQFAGSYCRPAYALNEGRALASFANGSPAIVRHQFGRGQAILNAFQSQVFLQRKPHLLPLATNAATLGKVRPHVQAGQSGQPELFTVVHDGPRQTVVFLFNDSATKAVSLPLRVMLPKAPTSAISGRHGPMQWKTEPDGAVVQMELPARDGDIVVFGHE